MSKRFKAETAADLCLSAAVVLFACLLGLTRLGDYDLWYHLATGRHVVAAGFPAADPFNYTQPASPMDLASWLAGVFFYSIWRVGGAEGLTLAQAALSGVAFAGLVLAARARHRDHGAFALVAGAVLVLAAYAIRFRIMLRPHMIEWPLLTLAVALWARRRDRWVPLLPAMVLLQMLWANVHGSFVLGLALPLGFLAADAAERRLGSNGHDLRRGFRIGAVTLGAQLLACLVNPVGLRVFLAPLSIGGWGADLLTLGEYQPMRLEHLTGFALRYTWGYSALALLGLLGFAAALARARRPPLWEPLLFAAFLLLPFVAGMRFVAEFAVVGSLLTIGWWLSALPSPEGRPAPLSAAKLVMAAALPVLWWTTIYPSPQYQFGLGEKLDKFPAQGVAFLKRLQPPGRLYNSIGLGGYLMWNLPEYRVFIDGRVPVYPREFYQLYRRAHSDAAAWAEIERTYEPTIAVIQYMSDLSGRERIPSVEDSPDWALVHWDQAAMIYARRTADNAPMIRGSEYRVTRPAMNDFSYLETLAARALATGDRSGALRGLLEQVGREVAFNPANQEPRLAKVILLQSYGGAAEKELAFAELQECLRLGPDLAMEHSAMAFLLAERGRKEEAKRSLRTALDLDPTDPMAISLRPRLGL